MDPRLQAPASYAPGPITEWGPRAWYWAHIFAINYSGADADGQLNRLMAFIRSLPCNNCSTHGLQYLRENPPDMSSSASLQLWMWNFHNDVNRRLKKPYVSFDEYQQKYADEICWANWHGGCHIAHYGNPVIAPISVKAIRVSGEQLMAGPARSPGPARPIEIIPNWSLDAVAGTFHLNGERGGYWYN